MATKQQLLIATNNKGKEKEFALLFPEYELISQSSLGITPEEEIGSTFFENSLAKARFAASASSILSLGDDSGLIVPALQNQPGLNSARYAGINASDADNRMQLKLALDELKLKETKAYYVCVLALIQNPEDPFPLISTGILQGTVKSKAAGELGFGYDSMFYPIGSLLSCAQMDPLEKARISHRGKAIAGLKEKIQIHLAS